MSKQAVVDSNMLIVLVDSRDKWHSKAQLVMAALVAENATLVYFDCVINETISVLARRAEEQKRSAELPTLLRQLFCRVPPGQITWVSGEFQRLYQDIVNLVTQTLGALNFHDAFMALVYQELGIHVLVSFDADFGQITWVTQVANAEEVTQAFRQPTVLETSASPEA